MTEPNFIILIDLDSRKTALQNCILKITQNNGFKFKKKTAQVLSGFIQIIQIQNINFGGKIGFSEWFFGNIHPNTKLGSITYLNIIIFIRYIIIFIKPVALFKHLHFIFVRLLFLKFDKIKIFENKFYSTIQIIYFNSDLKMSSYNKI